ncbi:hypothetical protein OSB04_020561 [Centaurea solstitialis]|uniref:Uncharacterized protein n=1 Tax=Centaurea solstitialis TaxID=347529 RepID=A0AA38TC33_9ASTR|nr:hypothetical protein OSB04_020561 [Centaurea solstitialis]
MLEIGHHMLGRLSSSCEEICLSGGLVRWKMKYFHFLRKRTNFLLHKIHEDELYCWNRWSRKYSFNMASNYM